jgi:hypothetical protein
MFTFARYYQNKIDSIVREGGSDNETNIHCPYCGFEHDETGSQFDLCSNLYEKTATCDECDKTFHYEVVRLFSTKVIK